MKASHFLLPAIFTFRTRNDTFDYIYSFCLKCDETLTEVCLKTERQYGRLTDSEVNRQKRTGSEAQKMRLT